MQHHIMEKLQADKIRHPPKHNDNLHSSTRSSETPLMQPDGVRTPNNIPNIQNFDTPKPHLWIAGPYRGARSPRTASQTEATRIPPTAAGRGWVWATRRSAASRFARSSGSSGTGRRHSPRLPPEGPPDAKASAARPRISPWHTHQISSVRFSSPAHLLQWPHCREGRWEIKNSEKGRVWTLRVRRRRRREGVRRGRRGKIMEGETKGNLNWRTVVRFTVLAVLTLFFLFILFNYFYSL